jgi:hypothetical protein
MSRNQVQQDRRLLPDWVGRKKLTGFSGGEYALMHTGKDQA